MDIVVIAHNIRSAHNVGSIFRTADGFGVNRLILSGYTPYPKMPNDDRLPHIAAKIHRQIQKTALGAEATVPFIHLPQPNLGALKTSGYRIVGLEQDKNATMLPEYTKHKKIALLLGEEVEGINEILRSQCDDLIEIPMQGSKESFNVAVACAIALYGLNHGS